MADPLAQESAASARAADSAVDSAADSAADPAAAAPQAAGACVGCVDLLLLWHMHQPDYRDRSTGEFTMPWVYLHAIKDYADMAWHLEQHPKMRAVINFVPVLLDQIEDYCDQFSLGVLRDPLLRLLARSEETPLSEFERRHALEYCFRANHLRLIAPFAPYKRLYDLFQAMQAQGEDSQVYLSDRYYFDLVTWFHLCWTGETVRRESEVLARLMAKGTHFVQEDRVALLRVVADEVRKVIPRYRALAERGQIELSTTPHCHPLAPLMLDFASAREALPEIALPSADHYPGGAARVSFHIDSALASHARRFGSVPQGIWPAEGALSSAFAQMLAARRIGWTASSEGVLANSLRASGEVAGTGTAEAPTQPLHQPYRASTVAPGMLFFFRDDRLSDLIGFVYSKWHGRDAANNFVHELESIAARASTGPRPLVSVMLDGENAWEYYPYNGFFFLGDLYRNLTSHPGIRTVTGSDVVAQLSAEAAARALAASAAAPVHPIPPAIPPPIPPAIAPAGAAPARHEMNIGELPVLAAGSWVYGNFATWIGARDKNRAWDLLCAAKAALDEVMAREGLDEVRREHALAQLADCEASDWFWWPGEDNPGVSVSAFEALFRNKLAHLYRLLQLPVPADLATAFSAGGGGDGAEAGGTMRRGSAVSLAS